MVEKQWICLKEEYKYNIARYVLKPIKFNQLISSIVSLNKEYKIIDLPEKVRRAALAS
jgi:hypothetical protein